MFDNKWNKVVTNVALKFKCEKGSFKTFAFERVF